MQTETPGIEESFREIAPLISPALSQIARSQSAECVERQFNALFQKFTWNKCANCGEEWSNINGKCPDCLKMENKAKGNEVRLRSMLGNYQYERMTLESFNTAKPSSQRLKEIATAWRPDAKGLYLFGIVRSGKSHIASALVREWYSAVKGHVAYWKTRSLMRVAGGMRGWEQENFISDVASKTILVLDDVGIEKTSDHSLGILYDILEIRIYKGLKGLIITTNFTVEALADKFGDMRLSSRLTELCEVIEVTQSFHDPFDGA